jgi:glycosyltransferase involved in cell wall biosynthesis
MLELQAPASREFLAAPGQCAGRIPAVSVIVPTYNRADLLAASLDSVARQMFTDYAIIVVDDGSNDHTRNMIADRAERIRYLWQKNQGVSEARNHALRIVQSEFVAFLDSDDLWQPQFLEATVGRLRAHPDEALVYTDFISTRANGRPRRGHRKHPFGGDVTEKLFASTFIHTSAVVARSAIIRDAGGFDGRLTHNEDYDLWLRLSLRHKFGLIPEPLCLRRCHADSLSRRGCSPDVLLGKAELLEHFHHNGGGEKVAAHIANARIAKLYYSAAKAFLRAGDPQQARHLLRHSLQRNPRNIKTYLWYLRAATACAVQSEMPQTVQKIR